MSKAAAPSTTVPSHPYHRPKSSSAHSSAHTAQTADPGREFIAAALGMSWQLAIVVLVPLLIGVQLDNHFGTLPLWTVVGLALAMVGMVLVVARQVQRFSPTITKADIRAAKKLRDQEEDS